MHYDRFGTRAIHGGTEPDKVTGAVVPPIAITTIYTQPNLQGGTYEYSRLGNPTQHAYERALASLEKGVSAFAFSSGMAAIGATFDLLDQGSHLLLSDDIYGGTYRMVKVLKPRTSGLESTFVDLSTPDRLEESLRPNTKMIFVETPTNPLLKIADLEAVAHFAHKHRLLMVVDNTFASPYNQNPFDWGADLVIHSVSKYLGGHSDVIAGAVIVREDKELAERLAYIQRVGGSVLGPFECSLALRSLRTLGVRMERHNENAHAVAHRLSQHPSVQEVLYPGLPSHPQHGLARRQMRGFSGMVGLRLGSMERVTSFLKHLHLFPLNTSLGGVESLVCHPVTLTHAALPEERRAALGIDENLLRLSIGIEDKEDLIDDLLQALDASEKAR